MSRQKELAFQKRLDKLRLQIDAADRSLIKALARRARVVEKIGMAKKNHGAPVLQKERWSKLVQDRTRQGIELGVNRILIHEIFESIQKDSLARQVRVKLKGKKT